MDGLPKVPHFPYSPQPVGLRLEAPPGARALDAVCGDELSDPGLSELAGVDAERPALDARWVNGRGVAVRVWTARPAPEADPQVYLQLGE